MRLERRMEALGMGAALCIKCFRNDDRWATVAGKDL
jgi:hypothetical protein